MDRTNDGRALLLLDMQRDFLADDGRLPIEFAQVAPLIAAAGAAVRLAEREGVPVIAVRNAFPAGARLGNLLRRNAALAGSAGAEWDPRVPLGEAMLFDKARPDAFTEPRFGAALQAREVRHLIVGGVFASACVTATVRSAILRGYQVTLLCQAIGDRTAARKLSALHRLAAAGAVLH